MASGHAHCAGDTEAELEVVAPAASWVRREPVLAAALTVAAAPLTTLVVELVDAQTKPAVAILLGTAVVLINAVGIAARQVVTPTAKPRLAPRVVLVPEAHEPEEG